MATSFSALTQNNVKAPLDVPESAVSGRLVAMAYHGWLKT
jgi:hypothetical protein